MTLSVTARGVGSRNTGSESTYAITPGSNFASNTLAVLVVSYDNSGTSGADPYSSIADSVGNTWTSRQNSLNDPGAANAGQAVRIFTSPMATASLTTSGTITVTFGSTTVARSYALWEIADSLSTRPRYLAGGQASQTSATPSITTASITSGNVVVAAVGREHNGTPTGDADTTNGTWSTMQESGVGATTSGSEIVSQYKVVTATATQTYNPTFGGTSADGCNIWVEIGAGDIFGTEASTGANATASIDALETFTGTEAATTGSATASISALETFTGTIGATSGNATASISGSVSGGDATGTIAITTASAASAISAEELFTGTAAATSGNATASIAATETFTGTIVATASNATASIPALETFSGAIASTSANATASIDALETFTGTEASTTGSATASISALETFTGTIGGTLGNATADMAGTTGAAGGDVTGTIASTCADATAALSGAEEFTGTAAATTASAIAAISALESFSGTISAATASATLTASGIETIEGILGATLAGCTFEGSDFLNEFIVNNPLIADASPRMRAGESPDLGAAASPRLRGSTRTDLIAHKSPRLRA